MAEVKAFQSQAVFNKPIGVVKPSSAGVQAAQSMERLGANMVNSFYKRAVAEEQAVGRSFAGKFAVKDEKGQLDIRDIDAQLSPVARQTAQPLIDENYRKQIYQDMKNEATRLRGDHKNDPDGFDAAYSAYVNKTKELVGERFGAFVNDAGSALAGEHTAALYVDQLDALDAKAFKTDYDILDQTFQEIAAKVSSGALDAGMAGIEYKRIDAEIDKFAERHSSRLSVTAIPEMRTQFKRAYFGANIERTLTQLSALQSFQDPRAKQSLTVSHINAMERALQQGSFEGMNPVIRKNLEQAGFTEALISRQNLDAESARVIASDLSTYEGNLSEQFNAEAKGRRAAASLSEMAQGNAVSQTDVDNVFETRYGIYTSQDMFNELPTLMTADTTEAKNFRQLLLKGDSPMPKALTDLMSDTDQLAIIANNGQLDMYLDIYRQGTIRMSNGVVTTVARGLSDKAMLNMAELSAYKNTVRDASFEQFFQTKQNYDRMPEADKNAAIKQRLGKDETFNQFLANSLDSDTSDEEMTFYRSYADELILMHGKQRAREILQEAQDKIFTDTDKIFGKSRSRYAPERVYSNREDQSVFVNHVNKQIARKNPNLKYGKDVFLVADPRTSPAAPTYMLVDKDGVQLFAGNDPLMVTPNAVLAARAALRQTTVGQLMSEMESAFDRQNSIRSGSETANPVQRRVNQSQDQFLDDINRQR